MTQIEPARLARPSFLADSECNGGLPVFATVRDALNAYEGDDAFCILYPQAIAAAADQFLTGFPGQVLYAVKANPHPAVLQTLWAAGLRSFDVASIAEIDLILKVTPDAKMYLMHPVKSRETIRHAYRSGIRDFAFDCADELAKINEEISPLCQADAGAILMILKHFVNCLPDFIRTGSASFGKHRPSRGP